MSSAAADRRRAEAVAWLRALLRGCGGGGGGQPLPPPHASEDDLRAALADGALLCAALRRLGCDPAAASDEGTGSAAAAAAAAGEGDVGRFLAAAERMGLPGFSPSDLDTGPVSSVVTCLLALRDQFVSHDVGGLSCSLPEKVMMQSMEFPRKENDPGTQNSEGRRKIPKNPAMSEPSSPLSQTTLSSISRHAGHSFHDVFQLRQGRYSDLPSSKISEMMKSTSLDNAPTQSLLSVVNVILDELVETKIGEIPYHLACLLRKVILEIERRISTQAEHIRNQNNLMKAREEKYKSRIRVLEALASGTSDQTHVNSNATNGKAHVSPDHAVHQMKMEKDKTEDKKRLAEKDVVLLVKDKEEDVTRLTKDKEDMAKLLKDKEDIIRLMKEKEEMVWMMREKENMVSLNNGRVEDKHQLTDKDVANSAKYRNEIIKLMKEKEDSNDTIMKLNIELEAMKSSYEGTRILLDSKKKEVLQLLMDKESIEYIVSQLKQELAIERSSHQTHIQELETRAFQANNKLEQRIKEMELMLEDSKTRVRDLEELLESRSQIWEQKEIRLNQFIGLQIQNIQDLRLSSVSIRHEILHCQKRWSEEICDLGQSLKVLTNAAENYHATLEENRKLFNEVQELKGCKANSIAHLYADILNYQLLILYAYLSGNIRVHCRIRPFLPGEDQTSTTIEYVGDNGELILANPAKRGKEGHKLFKFNKVLGPSASQDEVFKEIQPLIRSVLDGYNVCIFAYGQTGSGKTYTMTGPENATEKDWGVNYRALNDLFHISRSRRDTVMYKVSVQMIEIYNEQIHDLLGNSGSEKKYPFGSQALNQPNGLAVPDATMHPVNSSSDVIELMRTGLENRSVGATALNERSSRSHSVVTMHIQGVDLKTGVTLRGALHLVDLAGSGNAKTLMFVQVNPDVSSYAETLSTLKFADRVSGVELGAAKANKEGKDIKEFKEQLSLLKDKIAKKDEEISRLQLQSHNTPRATAKRADSLLKHSSSSPGISSLGSKIQHRRTASGGRIKIVGSRAGSDVDNFSDISDRHSEAGSMQSVDDIQQSREIMGLSKLSMSEMGHNSVDPELPCFGYDDSEGRLSDISDSGLSMGAETDCSMSSVVELTSLPDQDRVSGTQKEQHMAPSTPKDRLHKVATRASRTTTPKTPQSPTLWPKLRDPPPPRSPMSTSTGKVRVTQATSSSRNSSTQKRWT
uniref:Kinesin motor domain-containing protein n=1 Tax=Oryza rufipogon TaxID=4529 RepID=A0A0E0PZ40_ORYRU